MAPEFILGWPPRCVACERVQTTPAPTWCLTDLVVMVANEE